MNSYVFERTIKIPILGKRLRRDRLTVSYIVQVRYDRCKKLVTDGSLNNVVTIELADTARPISIEFGVYSKVSGRDELLYNVFTDLTMQTKRPGRV